jgi:DNA-cytosine methyltransferase
MRVLSLFDGISCARVALDRAGLPVSEYLACEIDKHAIKVSTKNYPDIVHLGDVCTVHDVGAIDLLIGGSPCTDLSIAKNNRQGLAGEHSSLFWEYVRILEEVKPTWFILENVASMPKADKEIITETLGVEPVMINAALVSAQSRKRLFWTNIPQSGLPADRGILLKDILQPDAEVDESMTTKGKSFCLTASYHKGGEGQWEYENNRKRKQRTMVKIGHIGEGEQYGQGGQAHRVYAPLVATGAAIRGNARTETPDGVVYRDTLDVRQDGKANSLTTTFTNKLSLVKIGHIGATDGQANRVYSPDGKSATLSANGGGSGAKTGLYQLDGHIRKLTPVECERLQGLPDGYTEGIAKTHRYKALGNGFNVDVIVHLLTPLRNPS